MPDLDFPDSPSENDKFGVDSTIFKYGSGKWKITKFEPVSLGRLDAGGPEAVITKIKGGSPDTDFTGTVSINGGAI